MIQVFMPYISYLFYGIMFLFIFLGAYFIYLMGQASGEMKLSRMMKTEARRTLEAQKARLEGIYKDEDLNHLFRKAGYPLRLNAVRFQVLRDVFILCQLVIIHAKWLILGGAYPISQLILLMILFIGLSTKPKMPVSTLLKYLQERQNVTKNREIIMLYAQLLNEYAIAEDQPTNLYSILRKFRGYYPALQDAFDKAMYYWRKSPESACEAFSKEVGTTQAKELADILTDIDKLSPSAAYTLLLNRYQHFNVLRLEEFRRKMKDRGIVGYFITFVPSLSIVINFCYIYYLQYKELIDYFNF